MVLYLLILIKALASAIAEEETLTKELEEEALKVDDHDDDISSDRDYTVSDGRDTPKDLSDEIPLDSSVSTQSTIMLKTLRSCL